MYHIDHYHLRGRKRSEDHLPTLLDDIRELAERHNQQIPPFAQLVNTFDSGMKLYALSLVQRMAMTEQYLRQNLPMRNDIV